MALKSVRLLMPVGHSGELIPAGRVVRADEKFGGSFPSPDGLKQIPQPKTVLDLAKLVARGRAEAVEYDTPKDVPPGPAPRPKVDPGQPADLLDGVEK